jgi:hypothetical protein
MTTLNKKTKNGAKRTAYLAPASSSSLTARKGGTVLLREYRMGRCSIRRRADSFSFFFSYFFARLEPQVFINCINSVEAYSWTNCPVPAQAPPCAKKGSTYTREGLHAYCVEWDAVRSADGRTVLFHFFLPGGLLLQIASMHLDLQ